MQMVMAVVALKCLETQLSPFPPVKDSIIMAICSWVISKTVEKLNLKAVLKFYCSIW